MKMFLAIVLGMALSLCINIPFGAVLGMGSLLVGILSFVVAMMTVDRVSRLLEKKTPYEYIPLAVPTETSYELFDLQNDKDHGKL